MTTAEEKARANIDKLLDLCGWTVQSRDEMNLAAARGVAVREFPLKTGFADYLLFVDRKVIGAIEAKKEGTPLTGVEVQSAKYSDGLPDIPPAWRKPLPFLYESTGIETQFTNGLDPEPRSRPVFAFHRPETLAAWAVGLDRVGVDRVGADRDPPLRDLPRPPLRARLRRLPPLHTAGLWDAQIEAITNLEHSLAADRPRALIQMATGSGKTFTAVSFIYRLIKFGGARRVLFLVDRSNLGKQTLKEFEQYVTPDDGRKFTELYNVQRLQSNVLDPVSKVCITTIQRLYSILSGEAEFDTANEEGSLFETGNLLDREPPKEVHYNPALPIEYFDVIITDECHRSIYGLWRQVLEYFDAHIIGLTATPSKQTFGFFNQNLVMEYSHERAVADSVNVQGEVYQIRTAITTGGGKVDAGFYVDKRDRLTRRVRWEKLDDELTYAPGQLDREVVAEDQIRTVIRTFRDKLFTDLFPGRTEVPKTLIFAKDDSHAEDIVRIVREEFGKGNDFCQKITYRVTGVKTEDLIAAFRNSYHPRIAVTVDMISTGTDIKPLEVLLFMRLVQSRMLFEQMLGRGRRVISSTDLLAVTPDARTKGRFVIVDAVGVTEHPKAETQSLERKRSVPFDKLLEAVALGARDEDTLSSLAGRLARLDREISPLDVFRINAAMGVDWMEADRVGADRVGVDRDPPLHDPPLRLRESPLRILAGALLDAIDPDIIYTRAQGREAPPRQDIPEAQLARARTELADRAAAPFDNPELRKALVAIQKRNEQTIDVVSRDRVLEAGFSAEATNRVLDTIKSFRQFIEQNRNEIIALQILFSRPHGQRQLTYRDVKDLHIRLVETQPGWATESLWAAFAQLEHDKVRGAGAKRVLTDVISLVRHAVEMDDELVPFPDQVRARYEDWLAAQELAGRQFTPEQRWWLDKIAEHVGVNVTVSEDDLGGGEFFARGGQIRARQEFGPDLGVLLDELNAALVE